jgi:hypothetical protein
VLQPNAQKPSVWIVDDRKENLDKFQSNHGAEFKVRRFSEPDEVLAAIRSGESPDALVCDIYFYKDEKRREEIEKLVAEDIKYLQEKAAKLDPQHAEEGIGLMNSVSDHFGSRVPFPMFAYTSKGPYLLHGPSFDKLEELGAKWLFKNKYSVQVERREIRTEIDSFRERRDWRRRAWGIAWRTGLIMSIVGAILGVIVDRIARCLGL